MGRIGSIIYRLYNIYYVIHIIYNIYYASLPLDTSGYVRPERVNKWPNSMTDIWMMMMMCKGKGKV